MAALCDKPAAVFRTRIKICGITRAGDALAAVDAGADAIGLVFHEPSPRAVSIAQAREVVRKLPAFVSLVGLFVNAPPELVRDTCEQLPLHLLQFHGSESPDYCRSFERPWMKALGVAEGAQVARQMADYAEANAIVLDSFRPGVPGGTGEVFDWGLVPPRRACPLVLAGGLNDTNVGEAIRRVKPDAVDVSGGVEDSPGIKNREKLQAFAAAVRAADIHNGNH